MHDHPRISISLCLGAALLGWGCGVGDDGGDLGADGIIGGDGDGDETTGNMEGNEAEAGDGDGDPGDGDPETGEPACDGTSPYMGGWDIGCCQDDVPPQNGWAPGGVNVNTIMPDWTLMDQFGEAVRMYDFCHDAVWFEYVALW
jgi:hypothetical protein